MMEDLQSRNRSLNKWLPYILVVPSMLYYILFWLRPVLTSLIRSFTGVEGGLTLQNYQLALSDPLFREGFINTAVIAGVSVTLEFVVALMLALLINRKFKGSGVLLFIAMIPMALPPVAVGAIWQTGLTTNGWINSLLIHLGLITESGKIYFMTAEGWRRLLLIILIDAWQVIPSVMIILLAGLQNFPKEMKEAGYVFGGNAFTVLRKITLPILKPTIVTAVVLRLISAIQIWLIVVMIYGFNRVPTLMERVVYYGDQVSSLPNSFQLASTNSIIVAIIVSSAALIYLKVSRNSESKEV